MKILLKMKSIVLMSLLLIVSMVTLANENEGVKLLQKYNFEDDSLGAVPSGFTSSIPGTVKMEVVSDNVKGKVLAISQETTSEKVNIISCPALAEPKKGILCIKTSLLEDQDTALATIIIQTFGGINSIFVNMGSCFTAAMSLTGKTTPLGPKLKPKIWNYFLFRVDLDKKNFDVFIDGKPVATNVGYFTERPSGMTQFSFLILRTMTGRFLLDDIEIYQGDITTGEQREALKNLTNVQTTISNQSANQFPGEKSDFRGYARYRFTVDNGNVMVICPKQPALGNPWIWRGAFWGDKVYPFTELTVMTDMKLLEQGFYLVVAGPNVQLGHPDGNTQLDAVYKQMTGKYGMSKKPALVGLSREGLSIYRWASANPEKVACIYLDNGVCNLKSWPGGKKVTGSGSNGDGAPDQWKLMMKIYNFKSDEEALTYKGNPIDILEPLAKTGVPLLHVCGDSDTTVPYLENSAIMKERYEKLGGNIEVILKNGAQHHPHGLSDSTPIVNFICANTGEAAQSVINNDPFINYLDDKAPDIVEDVAVDEQGILLRKVIFKLNDNSQIFAVIATPKTAGKKPGILILHGGTGSAEISKAVAWAQRGYIAVAPDLPGIADPVKLTKTTGRGKEGKYGSNRYVARPDAKQSILFDATLSALKALYLLRAQSDVDKSKIGVVGVSLGGYMTTMIAGLTGDKVRAAFSVFGSGFFEFTLPVTELKAMPEPERLIWLKWLDAGRRASGIKAAFFIAGATNDFFFWPPAIQTTLDVIPGEKNQVYAPNVSHSVPLPGGSVYANNHTEPFTPTALQPFPAPSGIKANWLAMELPFFDYYLKGEGKPFPIVKILPAKEPLMVNFSVVAPEKIINAECFWCPPEPSEWTKRKWCSVKAEENGQGLYTARLPTEATGGVFFVVVSDTRPVSASSSLVQLVK